MPKQLVAVDVHVADYQKLIDQLGDQYRFLVLTSESDPLGQLADFVSANLGFDAIHLVSHGAAGQIRLGSQTISTSNIDSFADQWKQIGAGVTPGGDFLLYGCDIAKGTRGQQLLTELARLTQLEVAASINRTGSTGDWVLESNIGSIEHTLPALSYESSLTDTAPTVTWTRLIGSTGGEVGSALTTSQDGSIYVSGGTLSAAFDRQTNAGSYDAFVSKHANNGAKIWTRLIGSTGSESASALTSGLDGSIYVAGTTGSATLDGQANTGGSSTTDAFVKKYNADGTTAWIRLIGSTGSESASALTSGLDGSIYVAGTTYSTTPDGLANTGSSSTTDAFVTKYNTDGTNAWTRLIGSTGSESASALTTGLDGSIYVVGTTDSATLDGLANKGSSSTTDAFLRSMLPMEPKLGPNELAQRGLNEATL